MNIIIGAYNSFTKEQRATCCNYLSHLIHCAFPTLPVEDESTLGMEAIFLIGLSSLHIVYLSTTLAAIVGSLGNQYIF